MPPPHFSNPQPWKTFGGACGRATLQKCKEVLRCSPAPVVARPPKQPPPQQRPQPGLANPIPCAWPTPHEASFAKSLTLTPEVSPEGRRLASSITASIMSESFLVCYLHCSLGEKTSLPTEVLQFLLFIQDYTSNPIIKHRSCSESRVIAYRCAQTQTSAHPEWPQAGYLICCGLMTKTAD